jgi:hypothetical protein
MRQAPDEVRVPGLGVLQWWAEAPYDQQHWYVGENQKAYRVTIENGQAGAVSDIDGKLIHSLVMSRPVVEEPALL